MQDIAGMRVVVLGTRDDQDRVVERICSEFENHRVVDRRAKPSHGYRAVHVIVQVHGCSVEVQVRTELQNRWAQLAERLGDSWGRQVRYGEPPTEPDRLVAEPDKPPADPGQVAVELTRGKVWNYVRELSELIDEVERMYLEQATIEEQFRHWPDLKDDESIMRTRNEAHAALHRAVEALHEMMDYLTELLQPLDGQAATLDPG
jgi:RelA/SpoT family protein